MAPVPARLAGTFRKWPLTTAGLGAFSSIWAHRLPARDGAPILVASDGTIDLQWIDHAFRVAGPDSEAAIEDLPAGALVIGFRFRPAAAAAWLGIAASEITNQRPSLDALWGARARRSEADVADRGNTDQIVRSLQAIVRKMVPEFEVPTRRCGRPIGSSPRAPRGAHHLFLARPRSGCERRTLRRRFDVASDYGPKTLDRIL